MHQLSEDRCLLMKEVRGRSLELYSKWNDYSPAFIMHQIHYIARAFNCQQRNGGKRLLMKDVGGRLLEFCSNMYPKCWKRWLKIHYALYICCIAKTLICHSPVKDKWLLIKETRGWLLELYSEMKWLQCCIHYARQIHCIAKIFSWQEPDERQMLVNERGRRKITGINMYSNTFPIINSVIVYVITIYFESYCMELKCFWKYTAFYFIILSFLYLFIIVLLLVSNFLFLTQLGRYINIRVRHSFRKEIGINSMHQKRNFRQSSFEI